ncbi:5-formyltetrahydrofolate cyclo-ligase [Aromatoleum sp.]|uniref:5-formyltetrahydrofolate cyclo-ligase n=1 Tax=Aromatoleum sp. TaxID=2307007 RepID=UPI002FCA5996
MSTAPVPPAGHAGAARRKLRDRALAERLALSHEQRVALTGRIEAHLGALVTRLAPSVLAFCWPYRGEPDLRAWMTRWLAHGDCRARTAALPVVLEKAAPMVFRKWTPGMELSFDRHGIPHPPEGDAIVPDVVLVPCNAFDADGYRLGYGGGYFDRTLAGIDPVAVGVGFESGRIDTAHPQPHDRPMDWIVTEAGAFRAGAAPR